MFTSGPRNTLWRSDWDRTSAKRARGKEKIRLWNLINEVGGAAFTIELLESCPEADRGNLRAKEREWIRKLAPSLNMHMPGQGRAEDYPARYRSAPCPCGGKCSDVSRQIHERTAKHQAWLAAGNA